MKWTQNQIHHLVETIFKHWKKNHIVSFKEDEKKVFERAVAIIKQEFQKESDLDREVNRRLDELEQSNPGEFQRHKMFPMLKQKLAKEKKVVL